MSGYLINLKTDRAVTDIRTNGARGLVNDLSRLLAGAIESYGCAELTVYSQATNGVYGTATFTAASVANNDTVVIAGTTLTGKTASPSGQAEFLATTANNTLTATALAACINANTTVRQYVTATSSGAVVTVKPVVPGLIGNLITTVGTAVRLAASAATITGGIGAFDVAQVQLTNP